MKHTRLLNFVAAAIIAASLSGVVFSQQSQSTYVPVTKAQVDRWMNELSNWGRWGKDDQLGALNLITPAKRTQAMSLAKSGVVVSLEQPIVVVPRPAAEKNDIPNGIPFYEIHFATFPPGDPGGNPGYSSDIQEYAEHGSGFTHLDALCHKSSDGMLYNGFPLDKTVDQKRGCIKLGLENLKEGIVTRGILVDMTRLKTGSSRAPGAPVYKEDVEAWEKQVGLRVSTGDALFLYDPGKQKGQTSGRFDLSIVPWLKARDVAVVSGGVNSAVDETHSDHRIILAGLGVYLLDSPDLNKLAETAARLNRWEFMLVIAPIPAPGGTGSLVNPLAMF